MIEAIKELAQKAGREIKMIYDGSGRAVTFKDDESPLTEADVRANEIIVAGLSKISDLPVVSEEGGSDLTLQHKKFWLVDPLDGTRDFVARKDTFVVCIALIETASRFSESSTRQSPTNSGGPKPARVPSDPPGNDL